MSVLTLALVACLVATTSAASTGKYTIKYDNIDLDQILKNARLLDNYYKCVIGKDQCTADGAELKSK